MNTHQLTRGAMVCGIYGLLLFANQQTALAIETSASWLFAFPILIYTATNGARISSIPAVAMALMTLLFGTFTTWFYSWSAILTGYVYGVGIYHHWKNMVNFSLAALLSIIGTGMTVYLWAGIFGYDLATELSVYMHYLPAIRLNVLIFLFVLLIGLLEGLCIHLVALMICLRMRIPIPAIRPVRNMRSPRWVGFASLIICLVFFLCQNMVELNTRATDILQIVVLVDCMVLDYLGVLYFLSKAARTKRRSLAFLAIMGAFIPVVNLIWIVMGELDSLLQLRNRIEYEEEL
jgi:hypothetical protein